MSFEVWFGLTGATLAAQFGAAIYFLLWLHRTLPSNVLNKYSISDRIAGLVQLGTAWKTKIDSSDVGAFGIVRKGFLWMIFFLIVSLGIEAALLAMVLIYPQ